MNAAEKIDRIERYKTLSAELDRTRHLKDGGLQFKDSYDEFFALMESLDVSSRHDFDSSDNLGFNHLGTVESLKNTKTMLDNVTGFLFERYGLKDITYSEIDTIFDYNVCQVGGISLLKDELIKAGMSVRLIEKLESRYLARVGGHGNYVCTMMDLFMDSKAKSVLKAASGGDVHLNFDIKSSHTGAFEGKFQSTGLSPIKPTGLAYTQSRLFSTSNKFKFVEAQ